MNKYTLTRALGKGSLYLKRRAPTILSVLAAAGVIGTAVLAVKCKGVADEALNTARERKDEELTKTEIILAVAPAYIPAIAAGATTIFCIFGANVLNRKQQASLISAYGMVDRSYKEYRAKLIELYGEEADRNIKDAIYRSNPEYHQIHLDVPDEKLVFIEPNSGEMIVAYEKEIMDAEYHFNRNYVLRGYATLNELYQFLGLPETDEGDYEGWSMSSGIGWIDFEHRLIDSDEPTFVIDTVFPPDLLEEYWDR